MKSRALFFRQYSYCLQNLGIMCIAYNCLPLHEMPDIHGLPVKYTYKRRPEMALEGMGGAERGRGETEREVWERLRETERGRVTNWILMSCQLHRVTP